MVVYNQLLCAFTVQHRHYNVSALDCAGFVSVTMKDVASYMQCAENRGETIPYNRKW